MKNTAEQLNEYDVPIKEIMDCRQIREATLVYEINSCYNFNYFLNILSILSIVFLVLLILVSWVAYCTTNHAIKVKFNPLMELSRVEREAKGRISESFESGGTH